MCPSAVKIGSVDMHRKCRLSLSLRVPGFDDDRGCSHASFSPDRPLMGSFSFHVNDRAMDGDVPLDVRADMIYETVEKRLLESKCKSG